MAQKCKATSTHLGTVPGLQPSPVRLVPGSQRDSHDVLLLAWVDLPGAHYVSSVYLSCSFAVYSPSVYCVSLLCTNYHSTLYLKFW